MLLDSAVVPARPRRKRTMQRPSGGEYRRVERSGEGEWCPGRDLNPDDLRHTPLKRTRIPIPPPGHEREPPCGGTEEGSRTHTPLRALAPEASASTDSATSARGPPR